MKPQLQSDLADCWNGFAQGFNALARLVLTMAIMGLDALRHALQVLHRACEGKEADRAPVRF